MRVLFSEMKTVFKKLLLKNGFTENKAELCASIFAENSRDGVYSHGLNRFPAFLKSVTEGIVNPDAEPECESVTGVTEIWNGHFAPGMYTARLAMNRSIDLAIQNGMGLVSVRNGNHWMRGGTYGWQAAEANCIGICSSNTTANMPPWGGKDPRLGNNPLVIAIPKHPAHVVLDMAMSQFSYGKLQEYQLKQSELPSDGGYDDSGQLTRDPSAIFKSRRPLPIGLWKGSGLSLLLDLLVATLSGGRTVSSITADEQERGLSQFFLCIRQQNTNQAIVDEIISFTKQSRLVESADKILYPGEKSYATRLQNEKEGIPVNEEIWQNLLNM